MQNLFPEGKHILLEAVPVQRLAPTTNRITPRLTVEDGWAISATHILTRAKVISERVFEVFKGLGLIVQAGDLIQLSKGASMC